MKIVGTVILWRESAYVRQVLQETTVKAEFVHLNILVCIATRFASVNKIIQSFAILGLVIVIACLDGQVITVVVPVRL